MITNVYTSVVSRDVAKSDIIAATAVTSGMSLLSVNVGQSVVAVCVFCQNFNTCKIRHLKKPVREFLTINKVLYISILTRSEY